MIGFRTSPAWFASRVHALAGQACQMQQYFVWFMYAPSQASQRFLVACVMCPTSSHCYFCLRSLAGVRAWHRASLAEWIRWNFSYLVSQATGGVLHRVSLVERLIRATDHMNIASHRPDRACKLGTNQTLRFPFSSKIPV